ncbi:hypothetical protein CHLNCDRAFT_139765 [Chlorella variabilis]|uniref:RAMA domain-containing protein n=1 Tax=Chlorella variabilis TaxID=554065 RepID=E1ZQX1_CHLVA|nr:hypothetical protein CHLNCDRAFT_139765 [Chlorella variabilis]EFN51862.1 hypothetical protein CHLNCDRAFT_139765 [Chlorella variabilis]|eukprot:XP_005843964.1 hypothetical protein CHLNCDRAFT_139765 [Chlorella variabilis]
MEELMDHHGAGPPGMYQQQQYILVDDHDHWPEAPNGLPTPAASTAAATLLPPLPGVHTAPPGKPVMMHAQPVEDEATESEEEHAAQGRSAALAWHHGPAVHRPESAVTAASQPSPTPSVSWTAPVAPMAAAPAPAPATKGSKASKPRKPGGKGGITLRLLIEEGILQPGHNVLSVDYKGMKQMATLMPDGRISSAIGGQHMVFESPSAFSIYLKRLVNPTRKADDGWKTVRVLEQFKTELAKRRMGDSSSGAPAPAPPPRAMLSGGERQHAPAPKRARVDSSSDLTGGSMAMSATVKEGDRNVLKLKFARPKRAEEGAVPAAARQGVGQAAAANPQAPAAPDEQGELGDYSRSRPRRQVHKPPRYAALGQDDEHALQPLEAYGPGPPGAPGAQPYALYVSPAAVVIMDLHAHLCKLRELATEDDSINVEMDPEDEWRMRQQVLQQHHHRDEASGAEPYIAAIVGPYDKRLNSPCSSITWFYVDHQPGTLPSAGQRPEDVGCVAKALQTVQLPDNGSCNVQAEIMAMPAGRMLELTQRYATKRDAVDMAGVWRDGTSCIQKLVASLLWGPSQQQEFGARVQTM